MIEPNPDWQSFERKTTGLVSLNRADRDLVLAAIVEVCQVRHWTLHAAHVRTNHVHVVASAAAKPGWLLRDFKAYSSRALKRNMAGETRWWTRHGSIRYLWDVDSVGAAIKYVVEGQGSPMAVFPQVEPRV